MNYTYRGLLFIMITVRVCSMEHASVNEKKRYAKCSGAHPIKKEFDGLFYLKLRAASALSKLAHNVLRDCPSDLVFDQIREELKGRHTIFMSASDVQRRKGVDPLTSEISWLYHAALLHKKGVRVDFKNLSQSFALQCTT